MPETKKTATVTTTSETTKTVQEPAHEPEKEERTSSLLTDILTIIGFAILFIIIIWGLVHLIELISASFSSEKPAATIQVDAPAQATAGQPVTVSWQYAPDVAGSYAFVYQCKNGLTFQTSSSTTSGIPCGVAYTVGNASSSLTVIPELSATSSVSDTLSIVFIPSKAGSQVQGEASMTINPGPKTAATVPVKKPTATTSQGSGYGSRTNGSGPAQLSVRIISGNIDANGNGTATFDIANVGGSTSGSYSFAAQLPTAQPYPYQSPVQAPLAPGSHVTSTLNFTDAQSGGGLFSVTIEGDGNTASDYASIQLSGPYLPYGQTSYGNYNYGYPTYGTYTY